MNITLACQIMEISVNSTQEEIKKKYKQLVLKYHPDRNKDSNATKKFIEMQEAYKFLRRTPTQQAKIKTNNESFYSNYAGFYTGSTTNDRAWTFTFG